MDGGRKEGEKGEVKGEEVDGGRKEGEKGEVKGEEVDEVKGGGGRRGR